MSTFTKESLKQAGDMIFSFVCRNTNREAGRSERRAAILAAIKSHNLEGITASFAGDYAMAKFGYGGGL